MATKLQPGIVTIDVQGVGYMLQVPLDVWDSIEDGTETELSTYTYVREDRLELFGFSDWVGRTLFTQLMKMNGVGPSLGLELCSVPRNLLGQAIANQDATLLTNVKGIGKKRAEKLLVDLKSLMESMPEAFSVASDSPLMAEYDKDAMDALTALGYDNSTIMDALKNLPSDIESTEERVAAALRSL